MAHLLQYIKDTYFTSVLVFFISLIGFFLTMITKNKGLKMFAYYFLAYFLGQLYFFFSSTVINGNYYSIIRIGILYDYLFTIFEFTLFYLFIKRSINHPTANIILKWAAFIYYMVHLLFFLPKIFLHKNVVPQFVVQTSFIIQASFLLIFCVVYYYYLFKEKPELNLLLEPSFWIVSGLTFCMISTLPLTFILNNVMKNNYTWGINLYAIIYIFYILLFLMIIRGLLCKKDLTN
jgi:hypothetical protein